MIVILEEYNIGFPSVFVDIPNPCKILQSQTNRNSFDLNVENEIGFNKYTWTPNCHQMGQKVIH